MEVVIGTGIAPKPVTAGTPFGVSNPQISTGAKPIATVGSPMPGTNAGGPTGVMTRNDGTDPAWTAPGLPAASGYITAPANQGGPTPNDGSGAEGGGGGYDQSVLEQLRQNRMNQSNSPFFGRMF